MKIGKIHFTWKDDEFKKAVDEAITNVLVETGLRAEGKSKSKLQASIQVNDRFVKGGGRGMRTATLRRSIHIATPGYIWAGDDMEPKRSAPERGGKRAEPERRGKKLVLQIGSGMNYAVYVHEMHYNPTVHQFILKGVEEAGEELPEIIAKHRI